MNKIKTVFFLSIFAMLTVLKPCNAQDWMVTVVDSLPVKVSNNAVCEGFINGNPYLFSFAGIDSTKQYSGIHLKSFRYDITNKTVLTLPDLPDTLGKIAAGASRVGDVIYIIGGYHVFSNGSEKSSGKVHRFDVTNNLFLTDGTDIPVAIDDHVQAVWRDSLIFVITGWSNSANVPNVQIYNPILDIWTSGTPTPNTGQYKAFGASGTIIGDTIYYFGGAAMGSSFPAQNYLRKGIIDPTDPTKITWSRIIPGLQDRGYRMACTNVLNEIHWIGGSKITYNFNGIAYNGSGGVPPANRDIYIGTSGTLWAQSSKNNFPMDLRGIASINDGEKYLAGGMLAGQVVTNKIYKLLWKPSFIGLTESDLNPMEISISPNPVENKMTIKYAGQISDSVKIEIVDLQGKVVLKTQMENDFLTITDLNLKPGIYFLQVRDGQQILTKKFVVQ